jgi:hypothetical protein
MHDKVLLHGAYAVPDRCIELGGPLHPVARGEHLATAPESGRQLAAALTAPAGHDRAPRAGPHPETKPVHPRTTPVVGLESPLALGHGSISLLRMAPHRCTHDQLTRARRSDVVAVGKLVRLARCPARTPKVVGSLPYRQRSGDCSRVLTRLAPVKRRLMSFWSHSRHAVSATAKQPSGNVAERLAPGKKTVSFCQCRSSPGRPQTTHRQRSEDARSIADLVATPRHLKQRPYRITAERHRGEGACPVHTCG